MLQTVATIAGSLLITEMLMRSMRSANAKLAPRLGALATKAKEKYVLRRMERATSNLIDAQEEFEAAERDFITTMHMKISMETELPEEAEGGQS